ncbi:MAG: ComF family protein [Cyclobacteriaceae bacterium]|nr:ComF family protein [Cyclobacteriaceae bacterium]
MLDFLKDAANLVFPCTCPGCNRPLLKTEEFICLHCQTNLPNRLNFKNEDLKQRFYGRIQLEEAYGFLLFKNQGLTQKLLHAIKYNGNQELAKELGCLFGVSCQQLSLFSSVDVVVPIPLHKSKYRLRGFNQSALIAEGLVSVLAIEMDNKAVIRKVKTTTQTKKTRAERWKNVDNTFEVVSNHLENKHVLLVDDVITTGATLESCGQTILASGASKISIACLALA